MLKLSNVVACLVLVIVLGNRLPRNARLVYLVAVTYMLSSPRQRIDFTQRFWLSYPFTRACRTLSDQQLPPLSQASTAQSLSVGTRGTRE